MNRRDFMRLTGIGFMTIPFLRRKKKNNMTIQIHSFSNSGFNSGVDMCEWNHGDTTAVSEQYPGLVVGVSIFGSETASVSSQGKDFTFVRADTNGLYRSEIWYCTNINTTTLTTISVSLSGVADVVAGACVYNYLGGVGVHDGLTGTISIPLEIGLDLLQDNSIMFSNLCISSTEQVEPDGNPSDRWNVNDGVIENHGLGCDVGPISPAQNSTIGYQNVDELHIWALSAVELLTYQDNPPAIMGM